MLTVANALNWRWNALIYWLHDAATRTNIGWLRKRSGLVACIVLHAAYNVVNLMLASLWP